MKRFLKFLVAFFATFYPYRLYEKFHRLQMLRYSIWLSRAFGKVGANPTIYKPMHLKGAKYIFIGDNFSAGYRTRIEAWDYYQGQNFEPKIVIGNNVCLNYDCHIGAINRIEIGDNVLIGSRVLITDHNHGDTSSELIKLPPSLRALISNGAVVIENNVWIGEGVSILSGVTIGSNSIIASNSVVTHSIPAFCVAAGVPAKVIKEIKL